MPDNSIFAQIKMDIFYVTLFSLFLIFLSCALPFLLYKKKSGSSGRLPPGKTGFPVIGESYDFLSSGWKGYPEKFIFDRMAKYSSQVFKTHLLGGNAVVLCGAAGNKFIFSNENKLVRPWWPSSVNKVFPSSTQTSYKEESITLRKMLPNFLMKPEPLQRYIGTMDLIAQRHFSSGWENKDQVEVYPLCKNYTFWLASRLFVSVDDPPQVAKLFEPFSVLASGIVSVPIDLPGTPFNKAIKAAHNIRKQLLDLIKQRKIDLAEGKATPTQDIMSHMLTTSDENGKFMHDDMSVADKIIALLVGGYDTASSACTFIVKYLAELPEVYEGVYNEQMEIAKAKAPGELLNWEDTQKMKYSWHVLCELLRLAPPLQGTFREALHDFNFNGFSIPKGWKLYWSVNSTHRNPECFPEPLKFDPSRFEGSGPAPYTFVPFGGGTRICPGREYARLAILVFMHNLVKRFKWEKIITDEKIVVDPTPKPVNGLPVRLYPHKA